MNIAEFNITALSPLQLSWIVLASISLFTVTLMTARLILVGLKWSFAAVTLILLLSPLTTSIPGEDFTLEPLPANPASVLHTLGITNPQAAWSSLVELGVFELPSPAILSEIAFAENSRHPAELTPDDLEP